MGYFDSVTNILPASITGSTGAAPATSTSAPSGMFSGLFGATAPAPKEEEQLNGVANGANGVNGVANGVQAGGKRKSKRQCGGSFHPYTQTDSASTASSFKGGRRRKTRKSYKKKSRRKSHRKRR